jgi:hypothetical protein
MTIESMADLRDFMVAKRADEAASLRHAADEDAIVAGYRDAWFPELASTDAPEPQEIAARLGQSGPTAAEDFAALGGGMGVIGHV